MVLFGKYYLGLFSYHSGLLVSSIYEGKITCPSKTCFILIPVSFLFSFYYYFFFVFSFLNIFFLNIVVEFQVKFISKSDARKIYRVEI